MSILLNNALANQLFHVELLNLYRENKMSYDGENMETLAIPSVEGKAMLASWMRVLLNTSKRLVSPPINSISIMMIRGLISSTLNRSFLLYTCYKNRYWFPIKPKDILWTQVPKGLEALRRRSFVFSRFSFSCFWHGVLFG